MKKLSLIILLVFVAQLCFCQSEEQRRKNFNTKKNVAIDGYDVVSYHSAKPVKGNPEIRYTQKGVMYLFVNNTNLEKFKADPEKYEPVYGGWCAYAMGETGEKVRVDPLTYKIVDGKLYLFYNFWGNNTLVDWNKKEKILKTNADKHWAKLIQ